jgi:hypothetical protein
MIEIRAEKMGNLWGRNVEFAILVEILQDWKILEAKVHNVSVEFIDSRCLWCFSNCGFRIEKNCSFEWLIQKCSLRIVILKV